ncbi:MAG: 50S ribosomal protein L29 [Dehalococcoidia bacterium]|nr:50S ribosomal protein L29 [Dehalococcoidia bacterium]MXY21644.1 50S ribosomal protein L29 [Dehalococcoidia bacterium]MYA61996.1 50S ribosomal protein L29 [Dehalococcoidia bacterium]
MAVDDLRGMADQELVDELYDTRRELMNLRFRAATMQLSDVNQIKSTKKRVAQILTVMRQRELESVVE